MFLYETILIEDEFNLYTNSFKNFEFIWISASRQYTKERTSGGCFFGYKKSLQNTMIKLKFEEDLNFINIIIETKKYTIIPSYKKCNHWDHDFNLLYSFIEHFESDDVNGRLKCVTRHQRR